MNKELHSQLEQFSDEFDMQLAIAEVDENSLGDFVIPQMKTSIEDGHREAWYTLIKMVYSVRNYAIRADILNKLLIMPGHELHQEITKAIQDIAQSSSVPYVKHMLDAGFVSLEYTGSEDAVISKWFGWALADIGTKEAISLMNDYSLSSNEEVAREMKYRLSKINT